MATLTNTQISVTYVGLLKTSASTVLSSTAQQITDGSGNNSVLFLSTAGVGIGGAASSGIEFEVTGNAKITGDLIVDNLTLDASTITSSGTENITLDSGGAIILDAESGGINFNDSGTTIGGLTLSSNDLEIRSIQNDKDIIFKGIDGSSAVTALTLDMSDAGKALFNAGATFGGSITSNSGIVIDNITIDGTEIDLSSGDLTLDVAGDIILDAGGGDINLKDDGTDFGSLTNSSGNLIIKSGTTTMLTGSGADATFAGKISSVKELINVNSANGTRSGGFEVQDDGDLFIGTATTGGNIVFETGNTTNGLPSTGTARLTLNSTSATFAGDVSININTKIGEISGYNGVTLNGTLDINDYNFLSRSSDKHLFINRPSSADISFRENNSDQVVIKSGGNVLVGKTAANNATVGHQLMAAGDLNSTVNGDTVARLNRLTSDGEILRFQKDTSTVGSIGSTTSHLSGSLAIGTTSTECKLTVASSGSGGANPSSISGSTVATFRRTGGVSHNANISILAGTTGASTLMFGDRDDEDAGKISYDHNTGSMIFTTETSERMRIDSSGFVGIGESSPDNLLTLKGTAGTTHQRFKEASTTIGFIGGANGIISSHNGKMAVRAESGLVLSSQGNAADLVISSGVSTFGGNIEINSSSTASSGDIDKIVFKKAHTSGVSSGFYDMGEIRSFTSNGFAGGLDFYFGKSTGGGNYASTFGMRLSETGLLGINGTPIRLLDVVFNSAGSRRLLASFDDSIISIHAANASANPESFRLIGDNIRFNTGTSGSGSEAMRVNNAGDVLFGTTSRGQTHAYFEKFANDRMILSIGSSSTSSMELVAFRDSTNGTVGQVVSNAGGVSFNSISDYRLKENIVLMSDSLDRISKLKPSKFNFKTMKDNTVEGFIAHELQEFCPQAVSGEKDKVNDKGEPEYQFVDNSKLVPLLVGAIQELKKEIEILKNK